MDLCQALHTSYFILVGISFSVLLVMIDSHMKKTREGMKVLNYKLNIILNKLSDDDDTISTASSTSLDPE